MQLLVLGPGCTKCKKLAEATDQAVTPGEDVADRNRATSPARSVRATRRTASNSQ